MPLEQLIGKWYLISTSGGMTGKGFPIKENTVIEFTSDCRYKSYEQDILKYQKTYKVIAYSSNYGHRDIKNIIQIGVSRLNTYEFILDKNRLILRESYVEGFTRLYRRVITN